MEAGRRFGSNCSAFATELPGCAAPVAIRAPNFALRDLLLDTAKAHRIHH